MDHVATPRPDDPVRVLVVDDHDVVRVGLTSATDRPRTDRGVRVAETATSVAGLRAALEAADYDVVVLDLALDDGSDPAVTVGWLVERGHRVLVYSIADDARSVRRALAAGAHGLSRKSEPLGTTLDKIVQVAEGQLMVSPEIFAMIDGDAGFVEARLSEREREVLGLYASGLEVPQIAQQLFVTENSTKEYLRRIRTKYASIDRPASSKVDLLRRAIEDGIVPPIKPQ